MTHKKIYQIITSLVLQASFVFGFNLNALAQGTNTLTTPSTTAKPVDLCSGEAFGQACLAGTDSYATGDSQTIITSLTTNLVNLAIFIGAAIAVFFIVLGGYKYITANGDDSKVKEGRSMVINALIGLVIAIASFTLVYVTSRVTSTIDISSQNWIYL
jgi:hypothetical protein